MLIQSNLESFFAEMLEDLSCQEDTKNYIIGIFGKYRKTDEDLSQCSITVEFSQARSNYNFFQFQKIADWLFYANSLMPQHLRHASLDYYFTIARLSYYSCYRMTNRQWKCYEELADQFILLNQQSQQLLSEIASTIA